MYGNAAAKNITELLETDSQSADRHHNRSNHIISLQKLHLHGDNKKISILMLLWKTCHSIHPSFFYCMSACPALRVTEGAVALPRYLGVKAGNILDKLPITRPHRDKQPTELTLTSVDIGENPRRH